MAVLGSVPRLNELNLSGNPFDPARVAAVAAALEEHYPSLATLRLDQSAVGNTLEPTEASQHRNHRDRHNIEVQRETHREVHREVNMEGTHSSEESESRKD